MLAELLLIATTGIYNPMDMSGHEMYPSGAKECDKYPKYAPPASQLAKLTLYKTICLTNGETIKPGHYLTGLSISKQQLLIFDGEKNIYEIDISKSEILKKKIKIATAKLYTSNNNESYIVLKDGLLKITAKVKTK